MMEEKKFDKDINVRSKTEEKKLTDEELKKVFFVLRHGSDEGFIEYVKSGLVRENEYNRQKAEIERLNLAVEGLTSVNNVLDKENTNVIAFNDALYREKTELQRQVDELNKQLQDMEEQRDNQAYIAEELVQEKHRWTEQAVKSTAKEILAMFDDRNYISERDLKKAVAERYGLEVE